MRIFRKISFSEDRFGSILLKYFLKIYVSKYCGIVGMGLCVWGHDSYVEMMHSMVDVWGYVRQFC